MISRRGREVDLAQIQICTSKLEMVEVNGVPTMRRRDGKSIWKDDLEYGIYITFAPCDYSMLVLPTILMDEFENLINSTT